MRVELENERQALAAFVSKFDVFGLGTRQGLVEVPTHPSSSTLFNPPKPTPGGTNTIFAERQKNCLVVGLPESLKITDTDGPVMNVTESPLRVSTKVKVEDQPSLWGEWEGVSMRVEDFEPEMIITSILLKSSFLKFIGVEVKDAFRMGKEDVPTTTL